MGKTCPLRKKRAASVMTTACRIERGRAWATAQSLCGTSAYIVSYGKGKETCQCMDYIHRGTRCKHIIAIMNRLGASSKGKAVLRARKRKRESR